MDISTAQGMTLRRLRLERQFNIRQLADKTYITISFISEVERGKKNASSDVLACLITGLGLEPEDFFKEVVWTYRGKR